MDNQLLALLQKASVSPPPQGAGHGSAAPAQRAGAGTSLDQLFASLGSPPPQIQAAPQPAGPSTTGPDSHGGRQAQLLGLLKGASSPNPDRGRSTPSPVASDATRERATSPSQGRAQDLLASLFGKLPQNGPSGTGNARPAGPGVPHTEPLIDHSSPPPASQPLSSGDVPQNGATVASTPAEVSIAPPPPPPPAQGAPAFTSSVFSFVSPFDAFEDIKPPTPKPSTSSAPPAAPSPAPPAPATALAPTAQTNQPTRVDGAMPNKPVSRHQSPAPAAAPRARAGDSSASSPVPPASGAMPDRFGSPRPEDMPPPAPSANAIAPGSKAASRVASSSGTPSKKKKPAEEYPMPYTARQHLIAGKPSSSKKLSGQDIAFDVTQANADSLAHAPESATERKISAVKTDTLATGLSRTRGLAVSDTLLAYVLSKGGIRVLNQASAANALLAVEEDGQIVKASTIDIVDGFVAAVLDDESIAVWRVESAGGDTLANELLFRIQAAGAKQIFWRRHGVEVSSSLAGLSLVIITREQLLQIPAADLAKSQKLPASGFAINLDEERPILHASVNGDVAAVIQMPYMVSVLDLSGKSTLWTVNLWKQAADLGAASISAVTAMSRDDVLIEVDGGKAFARIDTKGRVLASIKFEVPTNIDLPQTIHHAAARWDADNQVVWVAHFLRASLIGFATSSSTSAAKSTLTRLLEFPLEPLGDVAIKPSSQGDLEVFYKFPRGFSQVSLARQAIDGLVADRPSGDEENGAQVELATEPAAPAAAVPHAPENDILPEREAIQPESQPPPKDTATAIRATQAAAPTQPATSAPAVREDTKDSQTGPAGPKVSGPGLEDINGALKKSEDRLFDRVNKGVQKEINRLREQNSQKIDSLAKNLASSNDAQAKQLAGFETTLQKAVQASFDDSALPNLEVILNKAISEAVTSQLPRTIEHTVKHAVAHEFERNVLPHIGHALSTGLSPALENHMRQMVQTVVLPQLSVAVQGMASSLGEAVHREMLEVRKSISQEQSLEMRQSHQSMQNMSNTLSSLIEQVKMLTSEVQTLRQQSNAAAPVSAGPASAASRIMSPQSAVNGPGSATASASAPAPSIDMPEEAYEDHFLAAFAELNDQQLLHFVMEKYPRLVTYLPDPPKPAPLSQAVLLTIVHRLTKILRGNETGTREFQCALSWVFRAAQLLDRHSPTIQSYIQPVFASSRAHLLDTIRVSNLAPDARAGHAEAARGIMSQVISLLTL